jgi:hypothetical protein
LMQFFLCWWTTIFRNIINMIIYTNQIQKVTIQIIGCMIPQNIEFLANIIYHIKINSKLQLLL